MALLTKKKQKINYTGRNGPFFFQGLPHQVLHSWAWSPKGIIYPDDIVFLSSRVRNIPRFVTEEGMAHGNLSTDSEFVEVVTTH